MPQEVVLPRPPREAFATALQGAGHPEAQAIELARQTGRSTSALRRLTAVARPDVPGWAQPPHAHNLIALLLAGSWDDQRAADREILAELAGRTYAEIANLASTWSHGADPPLRQAGSVYAFVSPRDAWQQVGQQLTRDALERFMQVADRLLSLVDPRLTLPLEERWMAGVRGQLPAHSGALRAGIARSLALLSVLGAEGIARVRQDAIRPVLQSRGNDGLIALAQASAYPGFVARDAADIITRIDDQRELLLATLTSGAPSSRLLGQSLVMRWQELFGEDWVDAIFVAPFTDDIERRTTFLIGLPFGRTTWRRAATCG